MAVSKILGIETEYGIVVRGGNDSNPISASSMLINSYINSLKADSGEAARVPWDFEDETPGNDAREETLRLSVAPEVETHLVNTVLTNGARYYVDHAHPEYSAPECADAAEATLHDRAGEQILRESMTAASKLLPPGEEIVVYKNNSDGKGNSYGCHENYLMSRSLPFDEIVAHLTAHMVTRQLFTGSGKVGSEVPGSRTDSTPFQITQRADFFEEEVGLETTLKRPIINTRDEPHADSAKYRRLHVIAGDANMSEVATFLKLGSTAVLLAMLEDSLGGEPMQLDDPVPAMHAVSLDLGLGLPLRMRGGRTMTALEIQWEFLHRAHAWADSEGLDAVGGDEVGNRILSLWEQVLTGLDSDVLGLARQLDWVAKYRLFDGYRRRHDLEWTDARIRAMDLQYHDLRAGSGLAERLGLERITTDEAVIRATREPPPDTRAYFRGRCLERFSDEVVAANWDSIVFDVGGSNLRRVPMMEPTRGTRDHVGALIDQADSASDLLDLIGQ